MSINAVPKRSLRTSVTYVGDVRLGLVADQSRQGAQDAESDWEKHCGRSGVRDPDEAVAQGDQAEGDAHAVSRACHTGDGEHEIRESLVQTVDHHRPGDDEAADE
jgi:hypothetical protein